MTQTASPETPQPSTAEAPLRRLPVPVWIGLLVSLTAAATASWAALYWVAHETGWRVIHPPLIGIGIDTAHLLPAAVDIAAVSAGWVWLRCDVTPRARTYAERLTYVAAGLSLVGNAAGHLIQEDVISGEAWGVIVTVGAVPAVMVVALVHLAALCTLPAEALGAVPVVAAEVAPPTVAEAPAAPEVVRVERPTPRPQSRPTKTATAPTREAVVMDILTTAKTPDDVPGPSQIVKRWGVSKSTADRVRADALASLSTAPTPAPQEA